MRSLLASLSFVLLCVVTTACGEASRGRGSMSQASSSSDAPGDVLPSIAPGTTSAGGYSRHDGDKDNDDEPHGNSDIGNDATALLATYSDDLDATEKQRVIALVKRYYAAAAAGDGAKACSLLQSSLAVGLAEAHGQSTREGAKTCASALSALFEQQHKQLAADEVTTMGVTDVRRKGSLGLVILGFKRMPEGEILIEREGGDWKINSLLDSEMP
jgi:hypothetical protein